MNHGKKFNALSRKKGHRRALLANLSNALIKHKRISTTLAKAKALRVYLEPLITKSKKNTTHSRRVVFSYLQDKDSITELFGPISGKIGDRPGGYLRIIKTTFRKGDNAEMAIIEFVDFNELLLKDDKKIPGKKRTRRGGKKKGTAETVAAVTAAESLDKLEEVSEDVVDEIEDKSEEE